MEFLSLVVLNFGFLKENVITNVIWIHFFEKKNEMDKTMHIDLFRNQFFHKVS